MKDLILSGLTSALQAVAHERAIDAELLDLPKELERCKNPDHGDFASNVALQNAKIFKSKLRDRKSVV